MKKLVIALFVLGMALPSFAGLKEKDIVGSWSYKMETEYETTSGTLKFKLQDKKLVGEVLTGDGQTFQMTKVEIRENNVLYFELEVDYSVFEVTVTVEGKKYSGTVSVDGQEVPLVGEKIE